RGYGGFRRSSADHTRGMDAAARNAELVSIGASPAAFGALVQLKGDLRSRRDAFEFEPAAAVGARIEVHRPAPAASSPPSPSASRSTSLLLFAATSSRRSMASTRSRSAATYSSRLSGSPPASMQA